jgi:hypothetical protein
MACSGTDFYTSNATVLFTLTPFVILCLCLCATCCVPCDQTEHNIKSVNCRAEYFWVRLYVSICIWYKSVSQVFNVSINSYIQGTHSNSMQIISILRKSQTGYGGYVRPAYKRTYCATTTTKAWTETETRSHPLSLSLFCSEIEHRDYFNRRT